MNYEEVLKFLAENKHAKDLDLTRWSYLRWDIDKLQAISKALKKMKEVNSLFIDIDECELMNWDCFGLLWKSISEIPKLSELYLSESLSINDWDDARINCFREALLNMKGLETLRVTGEHLWSEKSFSIFVDILPKMTNLQEVRIGWIAFARYSPTINKKFAENFENLPNLSKLAITWCSLNPMSFFLHLTQVLPSLQKLTSINFSRNTISNLNHTQVHILMNSIAGIKNLKSLTINANDIGDWNWRCKREFNRMLAKINRISYLSLEETGIFRWGKKSIKDFSKALVALPKLTTLDLSDNDSGPSFLENIIILGRAFTKMKKLATLKLNYNNFQYIGVKPKLLNFINSLEKMTNLSELHMMGCDIDRWHKKNIIALTKMLPKMVNLVTLDLRNNRLGGDEVVILPAVVKALSEMPKLNNLLFGGNSMNYITPQNFDHFIKKLKESKSIISIQVKEGINTITNENRVKQLEEIAEGNRKLMQFTAADCLYQVHTRLKSKPSPLPTEIIQNILSFSGNPKVTKDGFAAIRNRHSSKLPELTLKEKTDSKMEVNSGIVKKRRV